MTSVSPNTPPYQPDGNDYLDRARDVLDDIDQAVARITDAEVEEHLGRVLGQVGRRQQVDTPGARALSPHAGGGADSSLPGRSKERIDAADRALVDAHARLRHSGVDSDAINIAFAIARDCLNEARQIVREARRELVLVRYERELANDQCQDQGRYQVGTPTVPGPPALDPSADPGAAQTSAEFMGALRMYRMWAGKPSYRAMETAMRNQSGTRFAASTIHAALNNDKLPALRMVEAIVVACGGSDEHQRMFVSAWRRLVLGQVMQDHNAHSARSRTLYRVSESA
jgi:hypothetical protein